MSVGTITRNNTLDMIRGVAICMVVLAHIIMPAPPIITNFLDTAFQFLRIFTRVIKTGGWTGVDLFFVLSGFLVSGLLFKEYAKNNTLNIPRFLIRRGFKIYPAFFFFLTVTFVFDVLFAAAYKQLLSPLSGYITDAFFIHNYLGGRWSHTWSLDVEEHFYLLLPLFFIYWIRYNKLNYRNLLNTYLCLAAIGLIGRLAAHVFHPEYNFHIQISQTHFRLDSLFVGVLISYVQHFEPIRLNVIKENRKWILPLSLFIISLNFVFRLQNYPWISIITLLFNPIAFGMIMINLLLANYKINTNNFIVYIGRYSYGIYLWHVFVNQYTPVILSKSGLNTDVRSNWFLYLLIYLIGGVVLGIVFTHLIETPFLKMRDKLYPSKSQQINLQPQLVEQA